MSTDADRPELFHFDNSFVRDLEGLYEPWTAVHASAPRLLVLNDALAEELGSSADRLRSAEGVAVLVGNAVPAGAEPVAQAYAGHQFGGYSPRLGDGRALLLGEIIDPSGRRRDLHLKGSGRTPFARGGDGLAAVGPMLREYVIAETMYALGIPTTRSLAVVATGDEVERETMLPGAVLSRIASSHLRVGTFQYAAAQADPGLLSRLVDHAIARHHPGAAEAERPALALLEAVVEAQATLVADWMLVGFVHGVMNTDNMTISGETIDYGPCAFMEAYDPATVFSSIDHGGRYAYGNQPQIAMWNLARLAEALLTLIDADTDVAVAAATEVVQGFAPRFDRHWRAGMCQKLALGDEQPGDVELITDLLDLLQAQRLDLTTTMRSLSSALRGDIAAVTDRVEDAERVGAWLDRWTARVRTTQPDLGAAADAMDRVNPVFVPRNHLVEAALDAATAGDLGPFTELVEVLASPFDEQPGRDRYAEPSTSGVPYRTFCGT